MFAHDLFLASVGLQSYLLKHRRTRGSSARHVPASDTIRGQRRHIPPRSNESSDDPPAAVKGKGRVGDQKTCTHPIPLRHIPVPSFVRTFPMSEEDGTAACSHMIYFWRPLVSRVTC